MRRVRVFCALMAAAALAACTKAPTPAPPPAAPPPRPALSAADLDRALAMLFDETGSPGMVVAVVRGDQVTVRGYGRMGPGDARKPDGTTLVRLESLSKLLASQALLGLAAEGKVRTDDPLQRWAPPGVVPVPAHGRPIELADLSTHASGIPREPDFSGVLERPEAVARRWTWLKKQKDLTAPGTVVAYSNAAYDLLADALETAAREPYPGILRRLVTAPLGMTDTTPSPTAEQCARLLTPDVDGPPRPCVDTSATAGSGGIYSTANDMGAWMKRLLAPDHGGPVASAAQAMVYRREALAGIHGMDHAGPAAEVGYGWVELTATADFPRLLQKTGGGAGFLTYIAIAPAERAGVFVAVDKVGHRSFKSITRGVNALMGPLVGLTTAPPFPPMVLTEEDINPPPPPPPPKPHPRHGRRRHR